MAPSESFPFTCRAPVAAGLPTSEFIAIAPNRLPGPATLPALTYHLGRFQPGYYRQDLFTLSRIHLPAPIALSVPKRQIEYLAGRLCARAALEPLGLVHHVLSTGADRAPVWPAGVTGSLTHAGELAAAVALPVALTGGIGIDIENIVDDAMAAILGGSVVGATELALLQRRAQELVDGDLNTLLTLVFSAKEAFFKAAYLLVGRYFGFDAIELRAIDTTAGLRAGSLSVRVVQDLCPRLPVGFEVEVWFERLGASALLTVVRLPRDGA